MARRLWHAVTPGPHWWTTRSAGVDPSAASNCLHNACGDLNVSVGFQVALPGTIERAAEVARYRIDRLLLAPITLRRARVEHEPLVRGEIARDVVEARTSDIRDERSSEPAWRPRGCFGARQPGLRVPPRPTRRREPRRASGRASAPATTAAPRSCRRWRRTRRPACRRSRPSAGTSARDRRAPGGVAAVAAGLPSRQIVIGVGEHRARDVPGRCRRAALPRHPSGRGARR